MEKFRQVCDSSTGINAFCVPPYPATVIGVGVQWLLFALRTPFVITLCAALLLTDVVSHGLRASRLFGTAAFVAAVARSVTWVLLLVLGNIRTSVRLLPPRPTPTLNCVSAPAGGDVVVCNMQSPFDVFVILASTFLNCKGGDCFQLSHAFVVFAAPFENNGMKIVEFAPSPFQRWKVARYVLHTAKFSWLLSSAASDMTTTTLDLSSVQRRAKKLGVPVLFFPEGLTSNGKGILRFPLRTDLEKGSRVVVSSLCYTNPFVHRVFDDCSWITYLSRLGVTNTKVTFTLARRLAVEDDATLFLGDDTRVAMASTVQVGCKPVNLGLLEKVRYLRILQGK